MVSVCRPDVKQREIVVEAGDDLANSGNQGFGLSGSTYGEMCRAFLQRNVGCGLNAFAADCHISIVSDADEFLFRRPYRWSRASR